MHMYTMCSIKVSSSCLYFKSAKERWGLIKRTDSTCSLNKRGKSGVPVEPCFVRACIIESDLLFFGFFVSVEARSLVRYLCFSYDWLLKKTTLIVRNQQLQIPTQFTFLGTIE